MELDLLLGTSKHLSSFLLLSALTCILSCSESSFQGDSASQKNDKESKKNKNPSGDKEHDKTDEIEEKEKEKESNDKNASDSEKSSNDVETDDTEFTVTPGINGECTTKENLVKNSDFEAGNVEFKSFFIFDSTCKGKYSPGGSLQYSVNSTPNTCHNGYAAAANDKGKMLVVNFPAAGQSETRFWCQTIKVVKGRHYKLSARLRAAVPSATESQPTQVTFTINGNSVMATFPLEKDWKAYKAVEIPAASGEVTLCGESRTQNTESTDLIADDFAFAECK
jgi:hypothetical protein